MTDDPDAIAHVLRTRARAGDLWLPATGSSMGRRFTEGSVLLVTDTGRGPRVGEIWAFVDRSGAVIVHRYLRSSRPGRLVFCGDRAPRADQPVPRSWLIGRVTAVSSPEGQWRPRQIKGFLPVARAIGRGLRRRVAGSS